MLKEPHQNFLGNYFKADEHPNTTKEHFIKAFNDVTYVQYIVPQTENYRKYFPNGHQ